MVLMEESKDKPCLVIDREPEGLGYVVEGSHILGASHIRGVSSDHFLYPTARPGSPVRCDFWVVFYKPSMDQNYNLNYIT